MTMAPEGIAWVQRMERWCDAMSVGVQEAGSARYDR
jgi:hypothetical protein